MATISGAYGAERQSRDSGYFLPAFRAVNRPEPENSDDVDDK